ncbi:hypothetical protein B6S12_04815 [Helicobacter valdiviensis]|uniref:Uncharacterized protein n=1 Tax=Helicobacter valdiviensis TaxID=1458358 RepID=A0A2W6PNI0_9HELI|nr:hypothetical protein [Helicobacter valdiviensis]PZT48253.1 hypothetical protein B6S12_04815 [Helicobacter valdiviensis]
MRLVVFYVLAVGLLEAKIVDNFLYFKEFSQANLKLEAILGESVKINGSWLKKEEEILDYKIVLIVYPCVQLQKESKSKTLCFEDSFKGK